MCGIIGYTGRRFAAPILLDGLETLEYRGYDSAGIAVFTEDGIRVEKARGRLSELSARLEGRSDLEGFCGIGHTRWATHGEPSDRNSHPHTADTLVLVHNGIIENCDALSEELRQAGYVFSSETDTEVAAKLIDSIYKQDHDPLKAIFKATERLHGSFAFGILFCDRPNTVYAIRRGSPLIVASCEDGSVIASDVPAILAHTRTYYRPDEDVIAVLSQSGVSFHDRKGHTVDQPTETVDWSVEQAQKGGFPHFMIKEIFEEPDALRKTVSAHMEGALPFFGVPSLDTDILARVRTLHIVACGTAMHAGLVGKTLIEKLARIPVNVEIASEFRYRDPILAEDDLVILLSQSGETADTLAALRHAKETGIRSLAIVNVVGSSVAREADEVLYTRAGPEIAVASTKAYSVQCALLCLIAVRAALVRGTIDSTEARSICRDLLQTVPMAVERVLADRETIARCAVRLTDAEHLFYIGRGQDHSAAVEASLKLKEISYIHSEAYAAGELKHGTISLVVEGTPIIALTTQSDVCQKTISAIREVASRGAYVLSVASESLARANSIPCDGQILIPDVREMLAVFPTATALQLLAYFVSAGKGLDVDKPRNLAKSVTVE